MGGLAHARFWVCFGVGAHLSEGSPGWEELSGVWGLIPEASGL